MAQNKTNGVIKWILIIIAVALLLFICHKAGWILNGNKNEVSEQEKKEAIQEAAKEVQGELDEAREEFQDAFK